MRFTLLCSFALCFAFAGCGDSSTPPTTAKAPGDQAPAGQAPGKEDAAAKSVGGSDTKTQTGKVPPSTASTPVPGAKPPANAASNRPIANGPGPGPQAVPQPTGPVVPPPDAIAGQQPPPNAPPINPPMLRVFNREPIDRDAWQVPLDELNAPMGNLKGDFLAWLISNAPITPAEEAQAAQLRHDELAGKARIHPAPPVAAEVLQILVNELPAKFRPREFRYTLHVIEDPAREYTTFTYGGGQIYVSSSYLDELQHYAARREMLAFELARQLGHTCLGHASRGYQLAKCGKYIERAMPGESLRPSLRTGLSSTGEIIQLLFTREQFHEADLFAVHLCRNVGMNLHDALDALRLAITVDASRVANTLDEEQRNPTATSIATVDPQRKYRAVQPSAKLRLKRSLMELFGAVEYEGGYGLFDFDPTARSFERRAQPTGPEHTVVLVHGMEGQITVYAELATELARTTGGKLRIVGFKYPNDGSLARSGTLLFNEMRRVFPMPDKVDFVCHSAGGLVFRYYAECLGGPYQKAVFQGTPHEGSSLARLRTFLEAKQFVTHLPAGVSQSLEQTILDGDGQISNDLEPDSLFLRYVNRRSPDTRRYTIIRGQKLGPLEQTALQGAATVGKQALSAYVQNQLQSTNSPELQSLAAGLLERFVVPQEILSGDGAVTVRSAGLPKCQMVETRVDHLSLTSTAECVQATKEVLLR